jgi:hypothetical protein
MILLPRERWIGNRPKHLLMKMVSTSILNNLDLQFLESSALTANNVDPAFFQLISKIHTQLQSGFFNDRIEQFNYFGNNRIRQETLQAKEASGGQLMD